MLPQRALRRFGFVPLAFAIVFGGWLLTAPAVLVGATGNTWTVNDLGDTNTTTCVANAGAGGTTCQLRDALGKAVNGNTIAFSVAGTIDVSPHGTLTLTKNVTITGPTSGTGMTVSGGGTVGVFAVNSGVTASLSALTIANGSASNGGGINNDGTLTVMNSNFSGNFASFGGGIYNNHGTLTVTNSTLSGNSASFGGGIRNFGGTLTVTNSTFSGNTVTVGGGINNSGTLNLTNTIVASNTGGDLAGSVTTGSHNLIGGTPLLAPLANYGGTTQTLALLPGSPAIDAGDDPTCAATGLGTVNSLDQRGIARTAHGAHCDIGAFESQGFVFGLVSGSNQTATVNTAFAPLVALVGSAFSEPVAGGTITFTGPASGAGIQGSPLNVTIGAGGITSVTPSANGTAGSNYMVTATVTGTTPASATFTLTNTPLLTGITLPSGSITGGATVTLTGAGFVAGTTVTFGGVAATNTVVNGTTITAKTPAHGAGVVDVAVTTNGATTTLPQAYTYGVVNTLPPAEPPGGTGGPTTPLPSPRTPGTTGGSPNPLPGPRP